jgi:hypothetical protein
MAKSDVTSELVECPQEKIHLTGMEAGQTIKVFL